MAPEAISSLERFEHCVREHHAHAAHRLDLLRRAQRMLEDPNSNRAERIELAERLERWRYQHLHDLEGELGAEDRQLIDALEQAAGELAQRGDWPARGTREAIADTAPVEPLDQAAPWLRPDTPLDELTAEARRLTDAHCTDPRTGRRRMLLYAPLYLSSHCVNYCVYCGFRYPNQIQRRHLELDEAIEQAEILIARGFRHVLLVAGDFPALTTADYFAEIVAALHQRGIEVAVEIAPQSTAGYARLADAGASGVTLYQETYDRQLYALYHPRGSKADYDWRLEGLDRAGEGGVRRLGLGVLLGLAEPWGELRAMIRHATALAHRFPDRCIAFSLPRIHEAPPGFDTPYPVDDDTLIRMYAVLRIAFPQAELVLSTRESPALRDRLGRICITQLSAGSSTAPGGYAPICARQGGEQFPISDHRSPDEVAAWVRQEGFDVSWRALRQ